MATTIDIQDFINTRKLSGYQIMVLALCFLVVAIAIGLLMDRRNPHAVLACSYTLAAAFILMLGLSTGSVWMLLVAAVPALIAALAVLLKGRVAAAVAPGLLTAAQA